MINLLISFLINRQILSKQTSESSEICYLQFLRAKTKRKSLYCHLQQRKAAITSENVFIFNLKGLVLIFFLIANELSAFRSNCFYTHFQRAHKQILVKLNLKYLQIRFYPWLRRKSWCINKCKCVMEEDFVNVHDV